MNRKIFPVLITLIVIGVALSWTSRMRLDRQIEEQVARDRQAAQVNKEASSSGEGNTSATPLFTMDEIQKHATQDNCWFVIDGAVVDATKYIASGKHPGGEKIVLGCGKDATALFNSRPGSKTVHSPRARDMMKEFIIGELSPAVAKKN